MRYNLGDKQPLEYAIPDVRNLVKAFWGETLFVFGAVKDNDKYRWCYGVGRVVKIIKGENFDLLQMNFGRKAWREIFVQYNHARRQLLTLKVGQLATFYGKFKAYKHEKYTHCLFYAIGLQAWYVPKAMDIRQMDLDKETQERLDKEEEQSMLHFIDDFISK